MVRRPPHLLDLISASLGRSWARCRSALFSLLFPWKCPGCFTPLPFAEAICGECAQSLKRICGPFCRRCGIPFPLHWRVKVCPECRLQRLPLRRIRSVFCYEGLVRDMIRDAKYRRAARYLSYFAEQLFVLTRAEFPDIKALVPVPLPPQREWERTFNQADFMARGLSRLCGVPAW